MRLLTDRLLLLLAGVVLVTATLVFLSVVVLRGGIGAVSSPSVTSLIGFVGTLLGILVLAFKQQQTQEKVNGHLQVHQQLEEKYLAEGMDAVERQVREHPAFGKPKPTPTPPPAAKA